MLVHINETNTSDEIFHYFYHIIKAILGDVFEMQKIGC